MFVMYLTLCAPRQIVAREKERRTRDPLGCIQILSCRVRCTDRKLDHALNKKQKPKAHKLCAMAAGRADKNTPVKSLIEVEGSIELEF